MKKTNLLAVFCLLIFGTVMMQAQASRTWVSGVGDDANPCSRTAPCKTFAGAISKTAAGGEIDALDPAGYGAVTITKGITIDGGGGQVASVLVSGTNGIVVQAGPSDVVILRNLRINGIGTGINGIRFLAGKALFVENTDIFGFTTNGIDVALGAAGKVFISTTQVQNCGGNGLNVVSTVANTQVSVTNSRFDLCNNGVFAGSNSRVTVDHSTASGNAVDGFLAAPTAGTAELNISYSVAANNANAGIQAGNGSTAALVRVAANQIHDNATGFAIGALGTITSLGNNFNSNGGAPSGTTLPQ